MKETHDIEFFGVTLTVSGYYDKGCPGDYFNAPEPRSFEIISVELQGLEINELIESKFTELENEILNTYY